MSIGCQFAEKLFMSFHFLDIVILRIERGNLCDSTKSYGALKTGSH